MPIYELLHKHQRRYRTNLEIQQARQIELEMKECTFQPKKISNNTNYNGSMYSRLPGAYVSPTKSSKSQRRKKTPSSETSYQPPDVWTPDGGDGGGGITSSGGSYGSSGRSGRSRGPEKVFGRRATNSGRDQFLGLESLVSSHQKKQQLEMETKKKEEELVQQHGSAQKSQSWRSAKSSEKEVKDVTTAAMAVATATIMTAVSSPAVVTSPSSTLTPEASSTLKTDSGSGKKIMKGGNGGKKVNTNNMKKKKSNKSSEKKNLKHKRSATAMHPPPEDLTSVPEKEKEMNDDMNDIDRVLAELRSVTTEDDKVGYKTETVKMES